MYRNASSVGSSYQSNKSFTTCWGNLRNIPIPIILQIFPCSVKRNSRQLFFLLDVASLQVFSLRESNFQHFQAFDERTWHFFSLQFNIFLSEHLLFWLPLSFKSSKYKLIFWFWNINLLILAKFFFWKKIYVLASERSF